MVVGLWKETWLQLFTILTQIDFDEMDAKCDSSQYRIAEEFRADAQLIVHNIEKVMTNSQFYAFSSQQYGRSSAPNVPRLHIRFEGHPVVQRLLPVLLWQTGQVLVLQALQAVSRTGKGLSVRHQVTIIVWCRRPKTWELLELLLFGIVFSFNKLLMFIYLY